MTEGRTSGRELIAIWSLAKAGKIVFLPTGLLCLMSSQVNTMVATIPEAYLVNVVVVLAIAALLGAALMFCIRWGKHIEEDGVKKKLKWKHVASAAAGAIFAFGVAYFFTAPAAEGIAAVPGQMDYQVIGGIIAFTAGLILAYIAQDGVSAIKTIFSTATEVLDVVDEGASAISEKISKMNAKQFAKYKEEKELEAAKAEFIASQTESVNVVEDAPKEEDSA